jgi:prevent-host-death family protein
MANVTVRELRNQGGRVIDRVVRGERLTVTRSGKPVAELIPVRRGSIAVGELLARWRRLPPVDPVALRRDLDEALNPAL